MSKPNHNQDSEKPHAYEGEQAVKPKKRVVGSKMETRLRAGEIVEVENDRYVFSEGDGVQIAVTGTNGKTTLTKMVGPLLQPHQKNNLETRTEDATSEELNEFMALTQKLTRLVTASKGNNLNTISVLKDVQTEINMCLSICSKQTSLSESVPFSVAEKLGLLMGEKFNQYRSVAHNETVPFIRTESIDGHEFRFDVRKIGRTEQLRRTVEKWMDGTISPPPKYVERKERGGEDKKLSAVAYFDAHYKEFKDAKAIYTHELRDLDAELYMGLSVVKGGISQFLPKKSDMITRSLEDLSVNGHSYARQAMQAMHKR